MIVYDAIFGRFELPSFLDDLLSSPEFRRLSEVRLININSPTLSSLADVRRYSHTLGVLGLAINNPFINLGANEYRALLASIIMHDAGTPAFAHLFEYQLKEHFRWDHESVVPQILSAEHHEDGKSHQIFGSRRPIFEKLCTKARIDLDIVRNIISKKHFASKLIFGSIDFDNIDNVSRMAWMLGYRFDIERMKNLAKNIGVDQNKELLLSENCKGDLDLWSDLRRRAYEVIVFDGPTVAGQAVLSSLIDDAIREGYLSLSDWHYNDHELLRAIGSNPIAKEKLERDFFGSPLEMKLITQVSEADHPVQKIVRPDLIHLINKFLKREKISRTYGYVLRDRGTFGKKITVRDPNSGRLWSSGNQSESIVIYGFGRGGSRRVSASEMGSRFLSWIEMNAC